MDAKLKRKWLKALRSGEYDQTTAFLCRNGEAFCCLGVLCDVQGAHWTEDGIGWRPVLPSGRLANSMSYPPRTYRGGLSAKRLGELVAMNDGGADFEEIADYIEREL